MKVVVGTAGPLVPRALERAAAITCSLGWEGRGDAPPCLGQLESGGQSHDADG